MRKAILAYSQYMRKKETQDPDNELTIQDCKDALKNIYNQCLQNSITLSQYKTSQPPVPLFLINLKSHLINFYILHGLDVEKQIKSVEPELLDFYCKDFYDLFYKTRNRFIASQRLKTVIREGLKIIEKKLLNLTNPNL